MKTSFCMRANWFVINLYFISIDKLNMYFSKYSFSLSLKKLDIKGEITELSRPGFSKT